MATSTMAKAKDKKDEGVENPPKRSFFTIAKESVTEFLDDECLNLAAAIAYYALQSVIPLILGFIAVGSLFLQNPNTRQNFISGIEGAIPQDIARVIDFNTLIENFVKGAGAAGTFAILTLLWTGSGIFDQFINAINKAYDVEKDQRNFFVKLLLRFGMLIGLGALLAAAFTITILFNVLIQAKVSIFGISPNNFSFLLPVLSYLIPLLLEMAIFAVLYKFSPARKGIRWKPVLVGAAIGAVAFEILKVGFTLYVTVFGAANSAAKTYGALGGVIVFLLFLYLSAAVILLGAEISAVLHNFKSGLAAVKTDGAVVEAKAENQGGELVPSNNQSGEAGDTTKQETSGPSYKGKTGATTGAKSGQPAIPSAVAASTSKPIIEKQNPVSMAIGTVVLVAVFLSSLFRRRNLNG